MKSTCKRPHPIFFLLVVLALIAAGYAVDSYLDMSEKHKKQEAYAQLLPLVGIARHYDFETKVNLVRDFVFYHTIFDEGEAFRKIWGNHEAITARLFSYASGITDTKVPMECSTRAGVMENILIALGYRVRSVSVYAYGENYDAHSFMEVQNPETGQWHAQDPQFDVFWRMKKDGRRASVANLVAHDFEDYEPCRTDNECGWNLINREGHSFEDLKERFGLAAIKDYQHGERILMVNESRFKLDTPQKVGGEMKTYCEHREKNCRGQIIRLGGA